jgi:predicted MPP superfamily phosphohydrolase
VAGAEVRREAEISRRLLVTRSLAIFAGLTATGIVAGGVRTALGDPVLKRVQIPLAKLPRNLDGYRIALVSDIHLGPLTGIDHTRRIVRSINGMQADMIAMVGDMVDGSVAELGAEAQPLAELISRDGAYFVTGNHEYYSGAQEWIDEVTRLGMRPLRNERIGIRGFDLAGVNDLAGRDFPEAGGGPDFTATLGDRDPSVPVVLLAHQPIQATEAAKFGVDLQLSGHTHGGQMVPFNYVARLQQPVISGVGEVDGTKVYVTNGAGFWGPPVRVGAPPDITLVELKAG